MKLPHFYVDDLIKRAILEDINYIDMTTDMLVKDDDISEAIFLAKDDGVIAGIEIALRVFTLLDEKTSTEILIEDGKKVQKGDVIAKISGKTSVLLKGERTSLNLVQHLSGIATATRKCVDLVAGTNASIADTRKTLPTLRALQKYAVFVGGGRNHRYNLTDACMLKDNHIDAYGSLTNAVNALKEKVGHTVKIEVEVRNFDELNEALSANVDVIMLDNMTYDDMKKAVEITNKRAVLEASGNITAQNISLVAQTGVDIISLGALTHSVKSFDISMKIQKTGQ
jgi:nicotinate-nucleotide pyrophosphorylase (carboxylating)